MKRFLKAIALTLVIVVVVSLLLAAFVGWLLGSTDVTAMPLVAWLLGGPLIGLLSGHGLIFYVAAIFLITPCLAIAATSRGTTRVVAVVSGAFLWCLIGWLMY